ncbi:hypothetical protein BHE74_00035639, partial [Ensete ventricosum]
MFGAWFVPRFAISTCTAWYRQYISVHQVVGTRTARCGVVLPKIDRQRSISAVGGRLREKLIVGGRLSEKKGRRRRGKEEKKKRGEEERPSARAPSSPARCRRLHAILARASSLPAGRQRPCVVASARALLSPAGRRRFFSHAGRKIEA